MDTNTARPPANSLGGLTLRRDDRGFTLVEMMIAILLLAIIFSAMVTVVLTSLTSMQREELRVRATQLVQEELERLRAIEWDCAGFDPAGGPYPAYNGNTPAAYDPAACSDTSAAPVPGPQTRTVDGVAYQVETFVYWIDDPEDDPATGPDPEPLDYKEFAVDIQWSHRGDTYTYTGTSTRVPTVEEVEPTGVVAPATFAITSFSISPSLIEITTGNSTVTAANVIVETNLEAAAVTVTSPVYGPMILTDTSGGLGTTWEGQIPANTTIAAAGSYDFTATANGLSGNDTAITPVVFAQNLGTTVTIVSTALNPATICVANSRKTHAPVTVTVTVDGLSLLDDVKVSWTDAAGQVNAVPTSLTGSGAVYTATIPADTRFNGSTTTLSVIATRIADSAQVQQTYTVPVVRQNNPVNCP